jgi:hypothetical protein
VSRLFHVTSSLNRESIQAHGLDWRRMGAARGIAGSSAPEQAGCFLCLNEFEMEWFVKTINTTGGPVDVWAVDGVDEKDLVESPEGALLLAQADRRAPPHALAQHCPPPDRS